MQATGCHYTSEFPLHLLVMDVVIYYKKNLPSLAFLCSSRSFWRDFSNLERCSYTTERKKEREEDLVLVCWHIAILKLQCKMQLFSNTVLCFTVLQGIVIREVASLNWSSLMQRSYSHQSTAYVAHIHHLQQYNQDNSCQISYHRVWIALTFKCIWQFCAINGNLDFFLVIF